MNITVADEIREALRCVEWYRGQPRLFGADNPTSLSIMKAEQILAFHAERYAQKMDQGDAAHCFWLGKDSA